MNNEFCEEARSHFNEPMLMGAEVVRCIGYGEDDRDCYVIMRRPHPHKDVIWHTMVGGYYFLDRLKGQQFVKGYTGEDWDDLFRLDGDLTRAGAPKESEFLLDIRSRNE